MECIIIHELVELTIWISIIFLFFLKGSLMYGFPLILIIEVFFLVDFLVEPLIDILLGGISTLFELIGALVLLGIIEEFIVTNSENPINFYPILFGILFGLLALILGKKIDYLHVGTWLHSGL